MLLKAEPLLEAKNSTSRRIARLDSNLISQLRQQGSGFNLEEVIGKLRRPVLGEGKDSHLNETYLSLMFLPENQERQDSQV